MRTVRAISRAAGERPTPIGSLASQAMDVPEIDVDELERHLAGGAKLVDVREHDEYESAHIEGAVLIPLATVPDNTDAFGGDEPVYVICAKGGRSARAVEYLRTQGIDAVNVAGGMGAWIESAKPAVPGPPGP